MKNVAEIFAGINQKQFDIRCGLEDLILLEHLVDKMDGKAAALHLKKHSAKEIICADYFGADFGSDVAYSCCKNILGGKILRSDNKLGVALPKDYMAAEAYACCLQNPIAKELAAGAKNVDELKQVMMIDILAGRVKGKRKKSIPETLGAFAGNYAHDYQPKAENAFSRELRARKPRKILGKAIVTLAVIGAGYFCIAKSIGCYSEWKEKDAIEFKANSGKLSGCESHLANSRYKQAVECNRGLKIALSDLGWFSSSKDLRKQSDNLDRQVEAALDKKFDDMLAKAYDSLYARDYSSATRASKAIFAELNQADYYSKQKDMLGSAKQLEEEISKASGSEKEQDGLYTSVRQFASKAYDSVYSFYASLGMGDDASSIATTVTFTLPFVLLARRFFRKKK